MKLIRCNLAVACLAFGIVTMVTGVHVAAQETEIPQPNNVAPNSPPIFMLGGPVISITNADGEVSSFSDDVFSLIGNPSVQKDLELIDEQIATVQAMQSQWVNSIQKSMTELRNGTLSGADYTANLIADKKAQQEKIHSLLLPHQIKRLEQVALQTKMKISGTANAISSKKLAEALELTEEQRTQLKQRSEELKKKLAEDIARLKQKAEDDLLLVLTPSQRQTLEELTGEKFQNLTKDWQEAIANRNQNHPQLQQPTVKRK